MDNGEFMHPENPIATSRFTATSAPTAARRVCEDYKIVMLGGIV